VNFSELAVWASQLTSDADTGVGHVGLVVDHFQSTAGPGPVCARIVVIRNPDARAVPKSECTSSRFGLGKLLDVRQLPCPLSRTVVAERLLAFTQAPRKQFAGRYTVDDARDRDDGSAG
jgi:hypothetical protein